MRELLLAAIVPAIVAALAIALLRRSGIGTRLSDHPNERSLHSRPTPRLGGLGLMVAVAPFAIAYGEGMTAVALALAMMLGVLSLADDAGGLPIEVRLPAHFTAALVFALAASFNMEFNAILSTALVVFAIAWMTNLFNFMDGSDGLAGLMSAIGFGTFAAGAFVGGHHGLAIACAAIASASLGFLLHNRPPASVFLGDSGSIPLGFLAATLGLHGVQAGAWPLAFPLLAFSPFIVDATLTILRRLLRGERIWKAHRTHHYQRLVLAGWSRGKLVLAYGLAMGAAGASALVLRTEVAMGQCAIISGWLLAYAVAVIAINRKTRKMSDSAPLNPRSTPGKAR